MRKTILCCTLFLTLLYNAQINFEKGYIITQDNQKKNVFIKNTDWLNSPETFVFKTDEDSPEQIGNVKNTKEFGVYGYNTFVNYSGSIDISSTILSSLSFSREPELKQTQTFVKQLVSGNKRLYSYKSKNILNYFYSDVNNNNKIELLIYKKYHPKEDNLLVATNEEFKNQLNKLFSDDRVARKNIIYARYNENDLIKIFYGNKQSDSTSDLNKENIPSKKNGKFNLSIRPGYNFYPETKIVNFMDEQRLPSTSNFRIGVEAEIILAFNKNKWSLIVEPTYAIYTSKEIQTPSKNINYNHYVTLGKYAFIDIPLGIRHYMYVNDKAKFFVNGQINMIRIKTANTKTIDIKDGKYTVLTAELAGSKPFSSFVIGAGYSYKNKYTFEVRYNTPGEILKNLDRRTASLQYFSLILGYNLF
jgi:hypothetical protein